MRWFYDDSMQRRLTKQPARTKVIRRSLLDLPQYSFVFFDPRMFRLVVVAEEKLSIHAQLWVRVGSNRSKAQRNNSRRDYLL